MILLRRGRRCAPLLLLLSVACAPAAPRLADVIVSPRPSASSSPSPGGCMVSGNGDPESSAPFDVFHDASGGTVIAVVRTPGSAPAELSQFAAVPSEKGEESSRRALARFAKRGIRLSGWVDLDKRTFTTRTRIDIVGEHLWAEEGTLVRLWGTVDGGRLLASAPTPFDEPKRVAFAVPCELIDYGRSPSTQPPPPPRPRGSRAHVSPGRLDFFVSPDGSPLFSAVIRDFREVEVVARELGRVRIIVGRDASSGAPQSLIAQGWVAAKSLGRPPERAVDSNQGSILDSNDRCPGQIIAHGTDIFLGSPRGLAIATLESGTAVDVVKREGAFVAIELQSGIFGPPAGSRWWVQAAAVSGDCPPPPSLGPDSDGCPDCTP